MAQIRQIFMSTNPIIPESMMPNIEPPIRFPEPPYFCLQNLPPLF